jgi:hypothetical protein
MHMLFDEIPEVTRQAGAVSNLSWNMGSSCFTAVLPSFELIVPYQSIAQNVSSPGRSSFPLTIAYRILDINYLNKENLS